MDIRKTAAEPNQEVRVIAERQLRVETADNVKFGKGVRIFLFRKTEHLIELHRVAAIFARLPRIRALTKLAVDNANIRVVDVPIHVVKSHIAVEPFAQLIRDAADGK